MLQQPFKPRYINNALADYLDDFCIAYFDDVLIYSSGIFEKHIEHVIKVFICLRERDLYIKMDKCQFHVEILRLILFPQKASQWTLIASRPL